MARELRVVGAIDPAPLQLLARFETLEDVLRWGGAIVDLIVQDEYTHDVVTAAGAGFAVFDTT
jgi:hypothetical protein